MSKAQKTKLLTSKSLASLARNFTIQTIEDELVESRKMTKHVFFDTAEVVDMLMGARSFEKVNQINTELFHRESSLVSALAYEGWLNKIYMLPPHQDELYYKITDQKSTLFPKRRFGNDEDIIVQLLNEAGVIEIEEALDNFSNEEDIKKHIVQNIDLIDAPGLFKVAKIAQHRFWLDRYKYVVEDKKIIQINNDSYDIKQLMNKDVFREVLQCLNEARPKKTENNLSDALSLTLLQSKLDKYKKDNKNPLPIYYVSSPKIYKTLRKYIEENKSGHFYYKAKNEKIPIIRDAEFFILDAVFQATREEEPFESFMGNYYYSAKSIRDEIESADSDAEMLEDILDVKYNKTFKEKTEDTINLQFFKKIWFENKGLTELSSDLFKYLKHYDDIANNEQSRLELEKAVEEQKNKIQQLFRDKLPRIKLLKKVLRATSDFKDNIENISEHIKIPGDVFREFALTRFSFKQSMCREIQDIIEEIFRAHHEENNLSYVQCISKIVHFLVDGVETIRRGKKNPKKRDELTIGLAVLWIFEEYALINYVCTGVSGLDHKGKLNYPDYRIALVHGASIFPSGRNKQTAYKITECLEAKFSEENYKVWIGLSYIYFNIWNHLSNYLSIPELMPIEDTETYKIEETYEKYYIKALNNLKKAIDYLKKLIRLEIKDSKDRAYRRTKYFYAINNYIYYTTKGGSVADFNALEPYCDILRDAEQNHNHWQNRFHDTLAWYNLRQAIRNRDNDKLFKYHIEKAESRCNGFNPVLSRERKLKNRLEDLIEKEKLHLFEQ